MMEKGGEGEGRRVGGQQKPRPDKTRQKANKTGGADKEKTSFGDEKKLLVLGQRPHVLEIGVSLLFVQAALASQRLHPTRRPIYALPYF